MTDVGDKNSQTPKNSIQQFRWMMDVSWDGTSFSGWQRQSGQMSIQQCIEEAVQNILGGEKVTVLAAGRTDAGVHALHQIISFACSTPRTQRSLYRGLNSLLPKTIAINRVIRVPLDFRARSASSYKHYEYHVLPNDSKDPFGYLYCWMLKENLDIPLMKEAAEVFVGTHDVSAFRAKECSADTTIRTILTSDVFQRDKKVVFSITGKGFLRHQVRIMAGTLVQVGLHHISVDDVKDILEKKHRKYAGPTAPAKGLWLCQTVLHEEWQEKIQMYIPDISSGK